MGRNTLPEASPFRIQVHGERLSLSGRLDSAWAGELRARLFEAVGRARTDAVLDLGGVESIDGASTAVLLELDRELRRRGGRLRLEGVRRPVASVLRLVDWEHLALRSPAGRPRGAGFGSQVRANAAHLARETRRMLAFAGALALCAFGCVLRGRVKGGDLARFLERSGVDAVPIVALSSLLLGLIMAFLGALQLEPYGAQIYVADMVALAMVRELGPVITSILVAGRSGSGYAAELGAMVVDEEVAALVTMGFDPIEFLAVPRVAAVTLAMPVLALISSAAGIAGGLVVGLVQMDLTLAQYLEETRAVLSLRHVGVGLAKSVLFGTVAAAVGCYKGLGVGEGAEAVGRASTSAVVTGIFLVILADALFAVVLTYLPF